MQLGVTDIHARNCSVGYKPLYIYHMIINVYSSKLTNTTRISTNLVTVNILFRYFMEHLLVACTGYNFYFLCHLKLLFACNFTNKTEIGWIM